MTEILHKRYYASMPLNAYDDKRLKLVVYGTAYIDINTKLKDYSVFLIEEQFINNEKSECRTLHVMIDYIPQNKKRSDA